MRGANGTVATELDGARKRLAKLEQQQERLVSRYRTSDDGAFPWELVEREIARVEHEKSDLRATIQTLELRANSQVALAARVEALTVTYARVGRKLDTFDFDQKRFAFDAIRLKVYADGRTWRLEGDIFTADRIIW